jgi:hypothetical protein
MSEPDKPDDDLLAQLRALPTLVPEEKALAARNQREARAAFTAAFEDEPFYAKILGSVGLRRAAVPLVLAGVVGIYLHWAATAAMKLMQ